VEHYREQQWDHIKQRRRHEHSGVVSALHGRRLTGVIGAPTDNTTLIV
jgi:hypothetical protein